MDGATVDTGGTREPRLFDPPLIAPEPVLSPPGTLADGVKELVGAVQPASRHIHPRSLVEPDTLELSILANGDVGERFHCGDDTDAPSVSNATLRGA
jgi:hypothetical protein